MKMTLRKLTGILQNKWWWVVLFELFRVDTNNAGTQNQCKNRQRISFMQYV